MSEETPARPEQLASDRAYRILETAWSKAYPYMEQEARRQGVPMPTCRTVNTIIIAGREKAGICDVEKGLLTLSAKEMDKLLEEGEPEPFVEYVAISGWFHELKHWKELMEVPPEKRAEEKKRYLDPAHRDEVEKRALDYGFKWAGIVTK